MKKLVIVIGATATGKSSFIKQNFADKDAKFLNAYDFQKRAFEELSVRNHITLKEQVYCLHKANEMLLNEIIYNLKKGRNLIVEHTLLKAKRRLAYIESIKKEVENIQIVCYVMSPSIETYNQYLDKRGLLKNNSFESYKKMVEDLEFPNVVEGFDKVYEVTDNKIQLRMDIPKPEIIELAHKELYEEAERMRKEDEKRQAKIELIESMNHRPFLHVCECCSKTQMLTAPQAFDEGWDYPPNIGTFGMLGPRICGDCNITETLYWKVQQQTLPIVIEQSLTEKELETWNRIKNEPESLLK